MSTQPVPTPEQYIQSEVSALAHRHVTLTYAVLGVLVLALIVGCFGGWVGLRGYEKALAQAEAAEQRFEQKDQQYQQMISDFQKQLASDAAERQAATDKQNQLQAQIDRRATQPLAPAVSAGLAPNASANVAATGLAASYASDPSFGVPQATSDGNVALNVKETQILTQTKVDFDRISLNIQDETALYTLEQSKTNSLGTDLKVCQDGMNTANVALADAKITIADFKKAAKKTKWQKIWQGFKSYGLPVLAYAAGRGKL